MAWLQYMTMKGETCYSVRKRLSLIALASAVMRGEASTLSIQQSEQDNSHPRSPAFNNCIFGVKYSEVSSFQVELGTIVEFDQLPGSHGEIGICDDKKCSSVGVQSILANVEGACDSSERIDLLDFTVATEDQGSLEVSCPDLSYQIDLECQSWDLVNRIREDIDDAVKPHSVEQSGAVIRFVIDAGNLVKCTVVCRNKGVYSEVRAPQKVPYNPPDEESKL